MTNEELIKLQDTQYKILLDAVKIFDAHNIDYFLAYGTLLGAVRHQGSIPWDYDIDICMTRDNYKKLMDVISELPDYLGYYHVSSNNIDLNSLTRIYKKGTKQYSLVHGLEGAKPEIFIDIFVLDNAKKLSSAARKIIVHFSHLLYIALLNDFEKGWIYENNSGNFIKKQLIKFSFLLKKFFKQANLEKIRFNLAVSKKNTGYYVVAINPEVIFPSYVFDSAVLMKYNDSELKCPIGYNEILTWLYGEYMIPPPMEKRFTSQMEQFVVEF